MSEPSELPFVSVVVSFHNETRFLRKCLESLLKQMYPQDRYEIILVNDGSTDASEASVSDLTKGTKVKIVAQADKGPAAGRNLGAITAKGTIVAFTDPDCVAHETWLSEHVGQYVSSQVGGAVGRVETDWEKLLYPIRISPAAYPGYITCNISYRREVLEEVGMFDENFRWVEDDELAYRVIEAGWTISKAESAVVYHPVKRLTLRGLVRVALKHRYQVLFYKKHPDIAKSYLRIVVPGPIALTSEFLLSAGGIFFLACVAILLFTNLAVSFTLLALVALLAIGYRRRMLRRKAKASIFWMAVYIPLVEIGRLWGSLKFRRFLL